MLPVNSLSFIYMIWVGTQIQNDTYNTELNVKV